MVVVCGAARQRGCPTGGVVYSGASLTAGYGMQYRENFLHHSLEVPGLHGRGGICAFLPSLLVRAFELRKLWMLMGRVWLGRF